MSRRIKPEKRVTLPDVRFNNVHLQMMINRIMLNGKKSVVTRHVYNAIDLIAKKPARMVSKFSSRRSRTSAR